MPWLLLDVAWIVLFAIIGRQNHGEESALPAIATTAWPFLAGYTIGAIVLGLRRAPRSLTRGVIVWAATVSIGMAIRTVLMGRVPATSFIFVALIALGIGLIGWRLVAAAVCRRRMNATTGPV